MHAATSPYPEHCQRDLRRAAGMVSGACWLVIGGLMSAPTGPVLSPALVWGVVIVADSAQFGAVIT